MESDAVRFLQAYNAVTADVTAALRMRPRPLAGKAVAEADAFIAWAKEERVDPVLFMRARHDAAPGARIPINRLHRVSPAFMAKYREWGEWKQSKCAEEDRFVAVDDDGAGMTPLNEAAPSSLTIPHAHAAAGSDHPSAPDRTYRPTSDRSPASTRHALTRVR